MDELEHNGRHRQLGELSWSNPMADVRWSPWVRWNNKQSWKTCPNHVHSCFPINVPSGQNLGTLTFDVPQTHGQTHGWRSRKSHRFANQVLAPLKSWKSLQVVEEGHYSWGYIVTGPSQKWLLYPGNGRNWGELISSDGLKVSLYHSGIFVKWNTFQMFSSVNLANPFNADKLNHVSMRSLIKVEYLFTKCTLTNLL